jgi:hypothetical protein
MTAEKSGKDGREGWGYNKLSEVGVSQLPAVTETWHYKYAQIEAVTGCSADVCVSTSSLFYQGTAVLYATVIKR